MGSCPLGKNIQNQTCTIDDSAIAKGLQIAGLCRTERMIDQYHRCTECFYGIGNFLGFTLTDIVFDMGSGTCGCQCGDNLYPCGFGKGLKFHQIFNIFGLRKVKMYQNGTLFIMCMLPVFRQSKAKHSICCVWLI